MPLPNLNTNRNIRKKTPSADISTMMYGKIPPQARELEEAVLGAILLEKSAFDTVTEVLKPECFYVEAHQMIFQTMQQLQLDNQPIDMLTVVEALKRREQLDLIGGAYYISKLTNVVVSTANIEAHARIVLQKFIQRELIRISGEVISNAYEDSTDVFDLLDDSETKMFNITNNYLKKNFVDIGDALATAVNRIDELRKQKDEISGVPSGFTSLDRITFGWQPTDLIILAARPSVGKTAFALNRFSIKAFPRETALALSRSGVTPFRHESDKDQCARQNNRACHRFAGSPSAWCRPALSSAAGPA